MNGKLKKSVALLLTLVLLLGMFCAPGMLASENLNQSPSDTGADEGSQPAENGEEEQTSEEPQDDESTGEADEPEETKEEPDGAEESGEDTDEPAQQTGTTGQEEPTEPEEPEKTLEELRDELTAILGESEETQAIVAEINRLIALGDPNGALRSYLEGSIRLHQMQYEMEQLQAQLDQLAASDEGLAAIDEAAANMGVVDDLLQQVEAEISEAAARLMQNAGYDGTGELAEMATAALNYIDGTAEGRNLATILLMSDLQESGLLEEAGLVTATDSIRVSLSSLAASNTTLSAAERTKLESASQSIAGRANNAEAMSPGWLVVTGGGLKLTSPVFTYNGDIMLSLTDAAAFVGGKVIKMEENDAVVIQAPGMVLEMVKGSSDAYFNDKLQKMPEPVLSFDGVCYIPLDTVLSCCGMARMTIDNYHLIYQVK